MTDRRRICEQGCIFGIRSGIEWGETREYRLRWYDAGDPNGDWSPVQNITLGVKAGCETGNSSEIKVTVT